MDIEKSKKVLFKNNYGAVKETEIVTDESGKEYIKYDTRIIDGKAVHCYAPVKYYNLIGEVYELTNIIPTHEIVTL